MAAIPATVAFTLFFDATVEAGGDAGPPPVPDDVSQLPASRDPRLAPPGCSAKPEQCVDVAWVHWTEASWKDDRPGIVRSYAVACEAGVPAACDLFAEQLISGTYVRRDVLRAGRVLEKACVELKAAASCGQAGAFHARNVYDVSKQDYAKAVELFMKGCDLGSGIACFEVSLNYEKGRGVPRDAAKAKQYLRRARSLGYRPPRW